ncbi:ATP synthase subunit g, mitochondrial [Anthonomus grandis grandis]|uniref:ATP synthase subunit g, mitochondrial n=1 Tax=Anthonomus grandis grandis TaxID=2921223 RepID=UPI002164F66E|nr:ATP synthase subunit g, mitochondrial [Anthonomus grandis grandis]
MAQLVSKVPQLASKLAADAKPMFETFMKYAKVELSPPTPADIPQIRAGIGRLVSAAKNGNWKNTTVKEGFVNTLIGIEVLCWFYVGECIGKRHLVGYDV